MASPSHVPSPPSASHFPCHQAGRTATCNRMRMELLRCPRGLVLVLSVFLHLLITHASPTDAPGCSLNFSGYTPAWECVRDNVSKPVKAWDSVQTTQCCLNALDTLSQAMAVWVNGSSIFLTASPIFLTREEWAGCDVAFHPELGVSISSCGFGDLYRGSSVCSSLDLPAIKRSFEYSAAVHDCSQLTDSDFDEQCAGCIDGIRELKTAIIKQLQVGNNDTEEMVCGVAVVVAVAATGINDATWVRDLYACLRAMNTEEHDNSKAKFSIPKAVLAAAAAIMGLVLVIILIKYVNKKPDKPIEGKVISTWSGLYRFSKAEIEKAINHGNQKVSLGAGSAGRVYRGVLPSGQLVAIKHIYKGPMSNSFKIEVEELSRIRHPNLVCLFGCCIEGEENYLVYEYCSNGNLAQNLLRSVNDFPWSTRVKILRDCALALRFLHNHPDGCIVHRDIKLTNILLTEKMEPKLSDFGLAKMIGMDETKVFTEVRGTIGYMDPEYMTNAKLTCASDIYSFGIVTLQLLSGRKVIELDIDARDVLTKKARDVAQRRRPLEDFVDPRLAKDVNLSDFDSILQVAVLCVASSTGRPSSEDLFHELDTIWKTTLANMRTKERSEMNSSSAVPQPDSLEVFEV